MELRAFFVVITLPFPLRKRGIEYNEEELNGANKCTEFRFIVEMAMLIF